MGYPPRTCLGHGRVSADAKCSALQVLTATTAQARIGYPMTAMGPGATILLPSTTKGLPQPAVPWNCLHRPLYHGTHLRLNNGEKFAMRKLAFLLMMFFAAVVHAQMQTVRD